MQRVLITGGAGFIGSRLVRKLLAEDGRRRIWVLDNLHPQVHGPDAPEPELGAGVAFLRGDVGEAGDVERAVAAAQPELVYHLAAETGTGQSYDEPSRYCRVNVQGTTHLIESIRRAGSTRRVVLAASRAVYGEGAYRDQRGAECMGLPREAADLAAGRFEVPLPAAHQGPGVPAASHAGLAPAPASIYASTKLMQEYLLTQAGEGAPWTAAMLRFQNVYGPGQSLRNPYTGVLSIFARQLLEGGDLAIFEDGEIARDFVYVDDVVDALARAGQAPLKHGTIVDIGLGQAVTILEVARSLMRALGRSGDSFRITGAFRVGDIRHARADIEPARRLLGWAPRVGVEEGLARLASWARAEHAAAFAGNGAKA
jgi:dTDP-L-rhamnose 4-epimerase